jgi:hypothetical protein
MKADIFQYLIVALLLRSEYDDASKVLKTLMEWTLENGELWQEKMHYMALLQAMLYQARGSMEEAHSWFMALTRQPKVHTLAFNTIDFD